MTNFEISVCTTFKSRFLGFMFQKNLNKILCFPRCNSIHTFFMKVPIHVIITTKEHIVIYQNIVFPGRIIKPIKNGYYTYEIPIQYNINVHLYDVFY